MYKMANLSFIDSSGNLSGISRKWEFERTNQQLANFAGLCATAEMQMMKIFSKWVGGDIVYTVSYPLDFGIVDIDAELQEAQAVLDMNLSNGLNEEVLKRVLATYCPDITDERFDEIVEELRQAVTDAENAEPEEVNADENAD